MKQTLLILLFVMAALLGISALAAHPALAACQQYTATNGAHVTAGRAYTQSSGSGCNAVTTYYAKGSNENLGTSGTTSTTLFTNDNGTTYRVGSCPTTMDADGDGYPSTTDCNDNNASIHPGATEICGDGIDQDCSGADLPCSGGTCQQSSATNDAHVSAGRAYTQSSGSGCNATTTYYAKGSAENMGTSGTTSTTLYTTDGGTTYHIGSCPTTTDADGDGYPSTIDCNDHNASIHPGATEICGDGIDQDCNGSDLACGGGTDNDGDGYPSSTDCNDNNPNIHPNAVDFCGDGIDQNCDGKDSACLPVPSCISNLSNWKLKYAPANANCTSCHTRCTPGGSSGRHSCTEGSTWMSTSCSSCHRTVH